MAVTGKDRAAGALLTIGGGMCWGLSGCMGQYLFQNQGMDSRWLVPVRLLLSGIVLFIFCLFRRRKELFRVFRDRRTALLTLIYTFGVFVCQFLYFQTIQWSTAGVGTILQDLAPIFILLWTCRQEKRKARPGEVAAIALAIAGVFLITTHGHPMAAAVPMRALLSGIGCAVCVMIYNVVPQDFLNDNPITVLQTWAFLIGGGVLFVIFRPWTFRYIPSPMGYAGIAFVVLIGNVTAFTIYMMGVSKIGPGKGILYGFSEPLTAAVLTFTIFGSRLSVYDVLGFAAVFAMLFLISKEGAHHDSYNRSAGAAE